MTLVAMPRQPTLVGGASTQDLRAVPADGSYTGPSAPAGNGWLSTQPVGPRLPADLGGLTFSGGTGGSTMPAPAPGTPSSQDTYNVTYNAGNGTAAPSQIPDAVSGLSDALAALASLLSGGSTTAGPTQTPVAVPVQNVGSDASASTGKGVVLVAGVILGLAVVGYYGYKHGWFGKKKAGKPADTGGAT